MVVVGIDGCGKSTLVRRLGTSPGIVVSREPTDGPHGRAIRAAFASGKRLPPTEERAQFQADRQAHVDAIIRPAIARGQTVLLDRYYYCTAAYQGTDATDAVAIVRDNECFAPRPQVVVFLQLPAAFTMARLQERGALTAPEKYETLREVAERYEALWSTPALMDGIQVVCIDARQSPEAIEEQVRTACGQVLSTAEVIESPPPITRKQVTASGKIWVADASTPSLMTSRRTFASSSHPKLREATEKSEKDRDLISVEAKAAELLARMGTVTYPSAFGSAMFDEGILTKRWEGKRISKQGAALIAGKWLSHLVRVGLAVRGLDGWRRSR